MTETTKVIVRFKNVDVSAKADLVRTLGATVLNVHSAINAVTLEIPKDKLKQLREDPDVMYAEQTSPDDVHILGFRSDIAFSVSTSSQTIPWGITKIRAIQVHSNGNKGTGTNVCILDTGIDYNHEDLKNNYKNGRNFVNNTDNPFDDHGHGTHVAGTIAAEDNDVGVIGVAPEANLLVGKVLDNNGSGSYDNIVAGIQWAIDNGAKIISMSFGGGSYSQALKDICDAAKKAGITLIAAAGNSNGNGSQNTIGYPAKFPSVVAIAATDSNDNRASFSSCGQEMWVAAPGVNVLSTVPKGSCSLCDQSGYKTLNGTSMATPHVSGMVALMLKANPNLTPDDVRSVLKTSSIDLGVPGFDIFFGYGRIDAVNAVENNPPPPPTGYDCVAGTCVQVTHENPQFPDLVSCQAGCKPTPSPVLSSIIIPSALSIDVGKVATLTSTCKDESNNLMKCPVLTWSSDRPDIASVVNGAVTGNAQGTANITCFREAITSNVCSVMVLPIPSIKSRYKVNQIGTFGVVVIKNPFGDMDSNSACAEVCKILKSMDKA